MSDFFKDPPDADKVTPSDTLVGHKPLSGSATRMVRHVYGTPEAHEAIEKLMEKIGPIMFYQPGEPGDCIFTICFRFWEFIAGENDILFGKLDQVPVYIDQREARKWKYSRLVLDVAPGGPVDFSIAAGDNLHFVSRAIIMNLEFFLK